MKKELFPIELGYKMPPEWYEHERTFMEWPIKEADWPEPFEEVLESYSSLVNAIIEFEPVSLIVRPDLINIAKSKCSDKVDFIELDHDDSWMRDNGPTFLMDSSNRISGVNWIFNAWGEKFPYEKDNLVASKILNKFGINAFNATFVMEGGSFHVDGEGTLITTEECLLNKNRNPGLSKDEIESNLKKYLGVEKIIWLKNGLYGDDTDGHVDNVANFVKPGTIIIQTTNDKNDPNYNQSRENLSIIKNFTDAKGRKLEIIEIPQPPQCKFNDTGLTFSYINFYYVNGGIILPIFGENCVDADTTAERIIKETFPDRRVVTVNGRVLARGGGNVHCLTQQMPKSIR